MATLGNISLGRISLGNVSLGRIGGLSKNGATDNVLFKQILNKLKKEHPQLFEALVCWYSPNLQSLTNKQLYDAMLVGEYPILRDLSGNGYDMELHGFDGTSASGVDGDGNLVFDGVNDYASVNKSKDAYCDGSVLYAYSLYGNVVAWQSNSYFTSSTSSVSTTRNIEVEHVETNASDASEYEGLCRWGVAPGAYNHSVSHKMDMSKRRLSILRWKISGTSLNADYLYDGYKEGLNRTLNDASIDALRNEQYAMIGSASAISVARASKMVLYECIRFDRYLTDSEIDWVKTNMLVSQEPKKFVVNLWHYNNGEPILLGTRRVNNGSEIGELPSYDLSATECTNEWYYDLTLSEDALVYDDDYVESDLNLYCSTMPIYQRMLDELEEEGLRDSLVCFYSPKLQGLTKESVLADKTLADLSGNGYDMTLYGFTEDETIIDDDGALMFDGVDDCGISYTEDIRGMTDICVISQVTKHIPLNIGNSCIYNVGGHVAVGRYINRVYTFGSVSNINGGFVKTNIHNKTTFNGASINSGTSSLLGNIRLASMNSIEGFTEIGISSFVVFNRSLTTEESNLVKQILKLQ